MSTITEGHGFHMKFANGWTISVQWGPWNYCDNKDIWGSLGKARPAFNGEAVRMQWRRGRRHQARRRVLSVRKRQRRWLADARPSGVPDARSCPAIPCLLSWQCNLEK